MKFNYKTPEIKVEELTKVDVLCASNEIPQSPDNNGVESNDWNLLEKFI